MATILLVKILSVYLLSLLPNKNILFKQLLNLRDTRPRVGTCFKLLADIIDRLSYTDQGGQTTIDFVAIT
jgi:hypothetical protein